MRPQLLSFLLMLTLLGACRSSVKVKEDAVYSRHLQQKISLHVVSTPIPGDKSSLNLLLINDAGSTDEALVQRMIDSLWTKKLVQPMVVVLVHVAKDPDYGLEPAVGAKERTLTKYSAFVRNELLPFIRKKAGLRRFAAVAITGEGIAGTAAIDVAWDQADMISKVGAFSPTLYMPSRAATADSGRPLIAAIIASRKRPKLRYFLTGTPTRSSTTTTIDDAQDLVDALQQKSFVGPQDITYTSFDDVAKERQPGSMLSHFVVWAFPAK